MDSTFISAAVQNMWNAWNIRGFMILSLCMQLVLALTAPFRMKTSNGFFINVVWSAYVLVDWAALFAFGLISNAVSCNNSNNNAEVAPDVMAFWAAFLLIHLGGPDTITAFSLEDNALWHRHLVGLIAQLFVFLYIFVKTLPHNKLLVPTTLIFVAGVIKYEERTRALYLASLENLKKSFKKTTSKLVPLHHGLDILHEISKGLIVDITPDLSECEYIRKFILSGELRSPLNIISLELRLLYEVLYTKIKGSNSGWGMFARSIAYFSTLAAFILSCLADKQEFHGVDIAITYALLGGVFILHVSDLLMLSTSEVFDGMDSMECILWNFGQGFLPLLVFFARYIVSSFLVRDSAIEPFLAREWSEKMGTFNLLSHCFKQGAATQCQKPGKLKFVFSYSEAQIPRVLAYPIDSFTIAGFIWNKLAEMRHTSRKVYDPELFNFVFDDLKTKTEGAFNKERMRKVYEARGDWALEEKGCRKLKHYINDFEYDNTILIWHVATEICYNIEGDVGDADKMKKGFSKVLSDYMMYLLVKQPKLMSAVAGITHIRYKETCAELKDLRRKFSVPNMQSFYAKICEEHVGITEPADEEHAGITEPSDEEHAGNTEPADEEHADIPEPADEIHKEHADITEPTDEGHLRVHYVLKDSCKLFRLLIKEENNRWEVIFNVWMELLSYAASHCRADSHARLLSEGGEFITFVWMLMVCFGVGA